MIVDLPWRTPPLRANDRRAWQAQHRAFQQALTEARWAVKAANLEPIVAATVTLHYRPKTRRRQDPDGIAPTLKPCLDALVAEGVLPDDSWVEIPETRQRIHPPTDEGPAMWLELTDVHHYDRGIA
jgi:crossover junction endodeoxyribonuclease RusA